MTSNWALPTIVEQYSETDAELSHVMWNSTENFENIKTKNGKFLKTTRDLIHIARDPKPGIKEKTYYLKCTSFNLLNIPLVINGIELKLTSNRFGRITDDTVQLILDQTLIGDNQASATLDPIKIYGDKESTWGSNIDRNQLLLPTFGVILRFKSHPNWPHKSSMLIDSVELRVH